MFVSLRSNVAQFQVFADDEVLTRSLKVDLSLLALSVASRTYKALCFCSAGTFDSEHPWHYVDGKPFSSSTRIVSIPGIHNPRTRPPTCCIRPSQQVKTYKKRLNVNFIERLTNLQLM